MYKQFVSIAKLMSGFAIVNTNYLFCNQKQDADKPHFHFLNQKDLNSLQKKYQNLSIIDRTYTEHILTVIRNVETDLADFRKNADRLIRILVEQALSEIDKQKNIQKSPLGYYDSFELPFKDEDICFVSILRAGNAFLIEALKIIQGASVGQILIQRDEETTLPTYYYQKLPKNIGEKQVILVDPMLATGGSASMAIRVLKNHGVKEENITFLNIVSCEEGIQTLFKQYPQIRVVTAQVDPILIKNINFIAPGVGDFGDRYFGTVKSQQ